MKKKIILLPLLLGGLISLSSCTLFDDADVEVINHYNPPSTTPTVDPDAVVVEGVTGKEINNDELQNTLCFKNISYSTDGKIKNTYKTGGENENEYNVNQGEDYSSTKSGNNYDLYIPLSASKADKHTLILFIHGGAWISGFKTDVNPYIFDLTNKGYITATIKYTLLKRSMDDPTLSIFRDLDEIDACIASIKSVLDQLDFDTTKTEFAIGGASSGAHLAMLYSYSRGNKCPLPIKFVVDAVGPVDIKPNSWMSFKNATDEVLEAGITYTAIEAQKLASNIGELQIAGDTTTWNEFQTFKIANGMCGLPFSLSQVNAATTDGSTISDPTNPAYVSMKKVDGGEDLLSVTYWMNKSATKYPIICVYAGKDSVVGIGQYANLEYHLNVLGIEHEFYYFKNSNHTEISEEKDQTQYTAFMNKIDEWCAR
ncbi:MAG: hypothetical protein J6M95_03715 [Bacilli bacterium]|nr:hypothetical protein [Bacilli bacterium]